MSGFVLPRDLKGILFDKDGTLVDYEKTWAPINREAARIAAKGDAGLERELLTACGVDPATGKTTADSLLASGNSKEIASCMVDRGSVFAVGELTRELDLLFVRAANGAVPITDLPILFSRLRKSGLALGIASSDNEAAIRQTVNALGIGRNDLFVAGYDSGHGHKPEPGMALAFCRSIGCTPGQMAMVGDNRHDLAMGRAAGAGAVIGVLSGTGSRATLEGMADAIIGNVGELPALLRILRLQTPNSHFYI